MPSWPLALLDLLYPPRCVVCRGHSEFPGFCASCYASILTPASPLCTLCGLPFATRAGQDHLCGSCAGTRPHFGRARAATLYAAHAPVDDPLKSTIQAYKYNRDVSLAPVLAKLLIDHAPLPAEEYDVLVPVPLHPERLRWRGFNQAHLLARRFAPSRHPTVDPFALRRIRATRPQVELSGVARRGNVAGAFRAPQPNRISGKRILLVDDVYTTGATVNECSRVLLEAGARGVDVLVLARAVPS